MFKSILQYFSKESRNERRKVAALQRESDARLEDFLRLVRYAKVTGNSAKK